MDLRWASKPLKDKAQEILDSLDKDDPILLLFGLARAWKNEYMVGPKRCYIMAIGTIAPIHKLEEKHKQKKKQEQPPINDENQEKVMLPEIAGLSLDSK